MHDDRRRYVYYYFDGLFSGTIPSHPNLLPYMCTYCTQHVYGDQIESPNYEGKKPGDQVESPHYKGAGPPPPHDREGGSNLGNYMR